MHRNRNFQRPRQRKIRFDQVDSLNQEIKKMTPEKGSYLFNYRIEALKEEVKHLPEAELKKKLQIFFSDLPLTKETKYGLRNKRFYKMTEIQRCAISHALVGRDILAASKTGSGKTLAYLSRIFTLVGIYLIWSGLILIS